MGLPLSQRENEEMVERLLRGEDGYEIAKAVGVSSRLPALPGVQVGLPHPAPQQGAPGGHHRARQGVAGCPQRASMIKEG